VGSSHRAKRALVPPMSATRRKLTTRTPSRSATARRRGSAVRHPPQARPGATERRRCPPLEHEQRRGPAGPLERPALGSCPPSPRGAPGRAPRSRSQDHATCCPRPSPHRGRSAASARRPLYSTGRGIHVARPARRPPWVSARTGRGLWGWHTGGQPPGGNRGFGARTEGSGPVGRAGFSPRHPSCPLRSLGRPCGPRRPRAQDVSAASRSCRCRPGPGMGLPRARWRRLVPCIDPADPPSPLRPDGARPGGGPRWRIRRRGSRDRSACCPWPADGP
jgi:hypothetical protein